MGRPSINNINEDSQGLLQCEAYRIVCWRLVLQNRYQSHRQHDQKSNLHSDGHHHSAKGIQIKHSHLHHQILTPLSDLTLKFEFLKELCAAFTP